MKPFDFEKVFSENYLYFGASPDDDVRADTEAKLIWDLLRLQPGRDVLDVGCGNGRIARVLAARGANVTAVDSSEIMLQAAEAHECRGIRYLRADMRELPIVGRYDAAFLWSGTFGYFSDEENLRVLERVGALVRDGARVLIDQPNRAMLLQHWEHEGVTHRGSDTMVERREYDPVEERCDVVRTYVRDGRAEDATFSVRLYGLPEMRALLQRAGLTPVEWRGGDNAPFSAASRRLIAVATRP